MRHVTTPGTDDDVTLAVDDDDAARGASIFGAGFADDPVMTWVFPGDRDGRRRKLETMFGVMLRDVLVPLGGVSLLGDRACAAWTPPGTPPWSEKQTTAFLTETAEVVEAGDMERLSALDDAARKLHPEEPHWYLGTLAARPELHGTGCGTAILAATLRRVDEERMPAYLESSNPRNVTLYLRHGFEVVGDIPLGDDAPSMTAMWRPAVS
jgi:GNAT superfamily N-acetyltransferase